jgi:hypothetical protein
MMDFNITTTTLQEASLLLLAMTLFVLVLIFRRKRNSYQYSGISQFLQPVCLGLVGVIVVLDAGHASLQHHFTTSLVGVGCGILLMADSVGALRQARRDWQNERKYRQHGEDTEQKSIGQRIKHRVNSYWVRYQSWRDARELKRLTLQEKARILAAEQIAAEKKSAEEVEKPADERIVLEEIPAEPTIHFQSEESTS